MKETKQFQTETKKLLDMMIHSIYTHKEIFLRELISNASDAIDKLKFNSISNPNLLGNDSEFHIEIISDKANRTITIKDNGIGMTKEEVITNIGTIAKSGSKDFMEKFTSAKENKDLDIIGQFGVGFYSGFMIADKVTLITKSAESDTGVLWESSGEGDYIIEDTDKQNRGTEIILHFRKDEEENNYSDYLEEYKIKELIKKYSDYVRYPIYMNVTKEIKKDDSEETVTEIVKETLNSMTPIWKKNKNDIKEEEYNDFYKSKFHDWTDPVKTIHTTVEGNIEYTALLFIPGKTPFNFHSKEYEKGLQLYTKNVFIMDKCKELIPDYFRFVRGLIDSSDFSLNISREILQQNKVLQNIANNLEKKIKKELETMLKTERDKYVEFFKNFGQDLKYGIYNDFGMKKDLLKDLLIFDSSNSENKTTLKEYVSRMKDEQKEIYFISGDDINKLKKLPQMEIIAEKGYEVLFFTDKIDEFMIQSLRDYDGKEFKSINQGDLDFDKEKSSELESLEKENEVLLKAIKESLKDTVKDVKLTNRLKSSPVCLVSGQGVSFEMEKVMKEMPGENPFGPVVADRILEINPHHGLFEALKKLHSKNPDELKDFSELLYSQALLIEGFSLDDPVEFSNKMANLMIKVAN